MPCRSGCSYCGSETGCNCYATSGGFDVEGALCDVLTFLEGKDPKLLKQIDAPTLVWWREHESREKDRIRKEALAKLTARERRALGLKK